MEYRFEEIQHLQFAVYDVVDKHNVDDVDKQKLIGTMECTLGDIVAAGDHLTKSLKLKGSFIYLPIFVLYLAWSLYMSL